MPRRFALRSSRVFLFRALLGAACALALPAAASAAACATGQGDYTVAQAGAGKTLFMTHCAACHKADLRGNSGPALAGPDFDSYLHFSKISAQQILDFMKTQMPYQAPGSLPADDYTKIFAFILQSNGYKSGDQQLTPANVKCVAMLPYPGGKH